MYWLSSRYLLRLFQGILLRCVLFVLLVATHSLAYPQCLNGGEQEIVNGRERCRCPHNELNAGLLCELVRANFEGLHIPLLVKENYYLTLPAEISFDFVNNEYHGTGQIITIGDKVTGMFIEISLERGRPTVTVNGDRRVTKLRSLNDNQWHHLSTIILQTHETIDAVVMVDQCPMEFGCSEKLSFTGISGPTKALGPLQIGGASFNDQRLNSHCLENLVINSELVDLWNATAMIPTTRGCPKCEKACTNGDAEGRCGPYGVCRNPITLAADQYACVCRPGFAQASIFDARGDHIFASSNMPCTEPSIEMEVNEPTAIGPVNLNSLTLYLSIRTRETDTSMLKAQHGDLWLHIKNGRPILYIRPHVLEISNVNVSDGLWHILKVTLTPLITNTSSRFITFSIDGLWGPFYNSSIIRTDSVDPRDQNVLIHLQPSLGCLTDVRYEKFDSRNNIYHNYPINEKNVKRFQSITPGCSTENVCEKTANLCLANEICIPEWRGYSCRCAYGYSRLPMTDHHELCVLASCDPNPCINEGRCSVLVNSTVRWGDETLAIACKCPSGWTGAFCEQSKRVYLGFLNWWLLPVIFVVILAVFWIIFGICWWKRRSSKLLKDRRSSGIVVEPMARMTSNGVAKAGEEDYRGSINLNSLKVEDSLARPNQLSVRGVSLESQTRDETTEGDRFLVMDEPLQYAFEGYDTSPPPTYFAPKFYDFYQLR